MESSIKYNIVKRAVDAADPCRLLAIGASFDEYELEAARITEAINDSDTEEKIAEIACKVFSKTFSREMPIVLFEELARKIRDELNKAK